MGEQLFTILRIARCYRTHLTGGYVATDLADPSPKLPYEATSHIRQPLSEILGLVHGEFIVTFELNEGGIPGEHWAF